MKDFFISYNSRDRQWAVWIAWVLEEAGYSTVIQEWDFRPGSNFVLEMQRAAEGTDRTIAILSKNYLTAQFPQPEWAEAFARDPTGAARTLIPFRVDDVKRTGLLAQRIYVDLFGLTEGLARSAILGAFSDRGKPVQQPAFPGTAESAPAVPIEPPASRVAPDHVDFPGSRDGGAAVNIAEVSQRAKVRGGQMALSHTDRLRLHSQLDGLMPQQFNMLIFALDPPAGLIPPMPAPQADRTNQLLQWAASVGGRGLAIVSEAINEILGTSPAQSLPSSPPMRGPEPGVSPATSETSAITPAARPVVFSIHGIQTRGAWQKGTLGRLLNENGFVHVALDFGWFSGLKLIIPFLRRRQLAWFLEVFTQHHNDGDQPPSVIAHSFGTYLVARAMQIYPEIAFDRIIFCGSIVERGYNWTARVNDNKCSAGLNDYGQMDFWAWIAKFGIEDAGDSGVEGFTDTANGAVIQRSHPEFRHSDYFYELNYRKNWIPFLLGKEQKPLTAADRPRRNWYFTIARAVILIVAVACIADGIWWAVRTPTYEPDATKLPEMAKDHEAGDFLGKLEKYKRAHENKFVTWEGVIVEEILDGYRIAPLPAAYADFRVTAKYDASDPAGGLAPGTKIEFQGVVDDINASGIRLKHFKVLRRLE